jgi:hypothetical protein
LTNDQAREYFKSKNLTYNDITEGDICVLVMLLNKHIKRACKNNEMSVDTMTMSEKIKSKYTTHGRLKECYLFMNSHYFTRRECISFNRDGFIGFAGWSGDANLKPIIKAFVEWCDCISKEVEQDGK